MRNSGKEIIVIGTGDPYSPQRCKDHHRHAPSRREQGLGTYALMIAAILLCECQGESSSSSSLKTELSLNGYSSTLVNNSNGNHTILPSKSKRSSVVEPRPTSERKTRSTEHHPRTSSSQRQGILRIQREWKDAIQAGIAFDWTNGEAKGKAAAGASSHYLWIGPLGTSLLTWHFSLMGVPGSAFEDGVYHGRIVLPPDYPSTPPRVMMLTPSGRFIPGHDICLSASNYHPETWQPNVWSLRTIVESLRLHMCTAAKEIGGLNDSYEKRRMYAQSSRQWKYPIQYRGQIIWIDHGKMLEKGFFPNAKDTEIKTDGDDVLDDSAMAVDENVVMAAAEKADSSMVQQYRPKRKRKRKYVETKANGSLLRVIRHTLTDPLRMSILTFFLLFVYLNLR